jgi:hypothetical protein
VGIEKTYKAFGTELVPYVRAEILYDTKYSAMHRQIYQTGVDIDITKQFGIEPYYAFQRDTATNPARLDRFGLILKYYRDAHGTFGRAAAQSCRECIPQRSSLANRLSTSSAEKAVRIRGRRGAAVTTAR